MNKRTTSILIAVFMLLSVVLSACQGGSASAEESEVIKMADAGWQTQWINNAIVGFILENGYGYDVEMVEVSTPIAKESLANNEVQIWTEMWRMNSMDWYEEVTSSGEVIDVGDIFEKSTQGWYVPRYVVEGDAERGIEPMAPDLKSVFDLPDYKDLFVDPENSDMGLFVTCITGWQCKEVNLVKLYAYDLIDDYNTLEPGAGAALDAAIAGAYKKGDPIVAYYWEPTWLMGTYDMVQLEEPEYTDECWAELEKSMGDDREIPLEDVQASAGCAYNTFDIRMGVNGEFAKDHEDVVELLKNITVGTDALNKTSAYMTAEEATADEAALWYFENNEDTWKTWLDNEVYDKVKAALDENS